MIKRGRKKKLAKPNTKPILRGNTTATIAGAKTSVINKIKRRGWVFSGISFISILFVISGYWFITQSVPASFTSKLTQVGDIELGYGERQSGKISPLCGCYDVGEWGNWRGVTFTARNVEIERKGNLPVTGYLIFAPPPTSTMFTPSFFKMNITYYLVELDENETFNPQYLLDGKFPENYKLVKKENSDEGFVQIFSENKLRVSLLGDKPIGAWIPMERTKVSINYQLRQDISEPTTTVIREKYLASTEEELGQVWDARGFYNDRMMAMPLGDFLGPNVIFWNEDEPTSILASSKVIHIREDAISGKKLVKGIVVNPPFAVRVVAIPFDKDAILKSEAEAPKRKEKDYSYLGSQGRFDSGEASVKIYTPDNQAKEFEEIYESMKRKGTTVSDFKTYYSSEIAGGKMEFRYPPIPPNNGFNIFGKINNLKIDSALGNLLIGSRSFNIEAPATVELKDIKNLEIKSSVMEIPIQIGVADTPSKIQLKATSEIYVNDESITRRMDNNKTLIDYVVLIATVLGTVLAVVSAIIAVKDFRKA
jgi:hypothetical protein